MNSLRDCRGAEHAQRKRHRAQPFSRALDAVVDQSMGMAVRLAVSVVMIVVMVAGSLVHVRTAVRMRVLEALVAMPFPTQGFVAKQGLVRHLSKRLAEPAGNYGGPVPVLRARDRDAAAERQAPLVRGRPRAGPATAGRRRARRGLPAGRRSVSGFWRACRDRLHVLDRAAPRRSGRKRRVWPAGAVARDLVLAARPSSRADNRSGGRRADLPRPGTADRPAAVPGRHLACRTSVHGDLRRPGSRGVASRRPGPRVGRPARGPCPYR